MEFKFETIATGNELLDGSTLDRHTQSIAKTLKPFGLRIFHSQILPDDGRLLQKAFVEASLRSDVVFVTGGLGPTDDDMSLEVAAKSFGLKMIFSKEAEKNVLLRLKKMGRRKLNPGHQKQMYIPEGSKVLPNREGTAPGIELQVGGTRFYFMPGVPREFSDVFYTSVFPLLKKQFSAKPQFEDQILKVFGWPESELNQLITKLKFPSEVLVGYRTHFPENHLKFRLPLGLSKSKKLSYDKALKALKKNLGEDVFAETPDLTFEKSCFDFLYKKKVKVAFAESCTGGLVSSMLTKVPGSSAVLDRSFIVYSNQAKIDMLGVRAASLEKHGAVSEAVVKEMARGALKNSRADRALSVSGIAGPSGGSRAKPVGTVWFGYADKRGVLKSHKIHLTGQDRENIQLFSAYRALKWICLPDSY